MTGIGMIGTAKSNGFTALINLFLPSAQHFTLVGQKDPFEPFDAVVDPGHADLLAGCGGPDHPLYVDDPSAVQHRPEYPEIVGSRLLPGMGQRDSETRTFLPPARLVEDAKGRWAIDK